MNYLKHLLIAIFIVLLQTSAVADEARVDIPGWPEDTVLVRDKTYAITLHSTSPTKQLSIVSLDEIGTSQSGVVKTVTFPSGLAPQSLTTDGENIYMSIQYAGSSNSGGIQDAEFNDINKPIILVYSVDELLRAADSGDQELVVSDESTLLYQSADFTGHAAQGLLFHQDSLYLSMCSLVLTPTGHRKFCYGPGTVLTVDSESGDAIEVPSPAENPVGFYSLSGGGLVFIAVPEGRSTVASITTAENGIDFDAARRAEFPGYYTTVAYDSQRGDIFLIPGGISRGKASVHRLKRGNSDFEMGAVEFGIAGSFALAAHYWQELDALLIGDGSRGELLYFQRDSEDDLKLTAKLTTRFSMIHTIKDFTRGLILVVSGNGQQGELALVKATVSTGDQLGLAYQSR